MSHVEQRSTKLGLAESRLKSRQNVEEIILKPRKVAPVAVKDKAFGIRLDVETYDALEAIAKRDDRSIGYVVREACREYIAKAKGGKS